MDTTINNMEQNPRGEYICSEGINEYRMCNQRCDREHPCPIHSYINKEIEPI